MTQQAETVLLQGGLDLVTQAVAVKPGRCIAAKNYESEVRGYRRIEGFERFDGRFKPSGAEYIILPFDQGSTEVEAGDSVDGDTSGASGRATIDAVLESGSYGGGDAAGYLVLHNVSGTFQDDEDLVVGITTYCVAAGDPEASGAGTDALHATYLQAAIEDRRDQIGALLGSGPVRGIATFNGDIYAWTDNGAGTQGTMYKATQAGWAAQSFGHTISFTNGTAAFAAGETVSGATTGSATIERVVKQSGTWGGGDAAGYLVLSNVTSSFATIPQTITDTGSGSATAQTGEQAITLQPGGYYRTIVHNFFGAAASARLYGVNGVGDAFEWDGTVMCPIRIDPTVFGPVPPTHVKTSTAGDPLFIGELSNHLFLGYAGGSVLFSGTGLPLSFDANDGAGELAFGQDLTGMSDKTKGAIILTGRSKISYLAGNDANDFALSPISEDSGAIANTLQVIGKPYLMDDIGIRSLEATEAYGNWRMGTVTYNVEPLLKAKRAAGVTPIGAIRVRGKDQYRLFYSDGTGLSIYFGRKTPEIMPFDLGFSPVTVHSGTDSSGYEILLAGADDGLVYQLDSGNSADGGEIEAYIRTSFLHQDSPFQEKRYHRARLELAAAEPDTDLSASCEFAYGTDDRPSGPEVTYETDGGGGFWNAATWNSFYWSSAVQTHAYVDIDGIGQNVAIAIMSDHTYEQPHTLSSLTVFYTPRRVLR